MNPPDRRDIYAQIARDQERAAEVAGALGETMGISPRLLLGRSRLQEVTEVRHAIILAMRRAGWTQMRISRAMKRDASSIRNSLQQAERWEARDQLYRELVREAEFALHNRAVALPGRAIPAQGPEARPPRRPRYNLPRPLVVERGSA